MNVILVGSQKNDMGKTIICIKIGLELANSGKKVILMDLSRGKIKIAEYLQVNEDIIYDIADVFKDTCTLDQGLLEIQENLSLLPSPRLDGKLNEINREMFVSLIEKADPYDYVIIDGDKLTNSFIDFSRVQNAITINNNDFSCIREINSDKALASKASNFMVLINRYNKKKAKKGSMMKIQDIEKLAGIRPALLIEENIKYTDLKYENLLDNNFLKAEINRLIANIK